MTQPIRLRLRPSPRSHPFALLLLFLLTLSIGACSSGPKLVKDPKAQPDEAETHPPRCWPMLLREVGDTRR